MVDYLAEILHNLRNVDYGSAFEKYFKLSPSLSTRDKDGVRKTFSGLMKLIYPSGQATAEQMEPLLRCAIEGRKRVKDQLMRIDATYSEVRFAYFAREQETGNKGQEKLVCTLEEEEYPGSYHKTVASDQPGAASDERASEPPASSLLPPAPSLTEGHLTFQENQKGLSFDTLIGPYLRGAAVITVTDPYIRLFYQVRNFMEFLETVVKHKAPDEEVSVHLVTTEDEFKGEQQKAHFEKMQAAASPVGVNFTWEFDGTGTLHARHIVTDHGWKISLDRGLDIFQHYEMNDAFAFTNRLQQYRPCKAFEITYIRQEENGVDPG